MKPFLITVAVIALVSLYNALWEYLPLFPAFITGMAFIALFWGVIVTISIMFEGKK